MFRLLGADRRDLGHLAADLLHVFLGKLRQDVRARLFSQHDQQYGRFPQPGHRFLVRFGGVEDHPWTSSSSRIQARRTWADISGSCLIFSRRCLAITSAVLVITGESFRALSAWAS